MESARRARPADADRIAQLSGDLRAELGALRGGDLWTRREAEAVADALAWGSRLETPRTAETVLVGAIDDAVVGYGVLVVERLRDGSHHAVVTELFVEPEAREVGVGEALLDALVDEARRAGAGGIDALALPGHRATKNFFEGAGFTARAIVMHRDA